jgi:hypothetical protein
MSDPYVYYHKDGIYKRTFIKNFNMRYQIPGMIRNLDYETLFVGTSMVHNFQEDSINKKFNTESLNASISGSSAREQMKAAELAIASKDVKHIFWEINYDSLAGDADRISTAFPEFLYDRKILNDLPYLLSYDAIKKIDYQIKNQDKVNMDSDPLTYYKFGQKKEPLTVEKMEQAIEGLSAPPHKSHNYQSYMESFRENMLALVRKHPDIQFTFFYTPYPVTRHVVVDDAAPVITDDRLKVKLEVYKEIQAYANAEVFDFQDEQSITFNVGNYMDRSHYFASINQWMLDQMASKEPILSLSEYKEKTEDMRRQIRGFSFEQLVEV